LNLFQGKAASFGVEPWYFYISVASLLPYGPFYIAATFISIKYKLKNPVIWLVILYVLVHSLIGHKELRFLVPILCFMPLVIAYSYDFLIDRAIIIKNWWQTLWKYLWYVNCVFAILCAIIPSGTSVFLCRAIYNKFSEPMQFYAITEGGNELNFYKRKNVELFYIKDIKQVQCNKNKVCLLALTCQQAQANPNINGKIIYNSCPSWLLKLNFNGWLDRAAVYNIYQINNTESGK
jgi:phosphatidylinositol glycan class B